jgi:3-hydroxybutyryl-CoA dehydratase
MTKEEKMSQEPAHPRGRYFEEFTVGDKMTSQGRTITEADIVAFAGLSGDYNPIHTDAEFAKTGMFGERIAHGLLILSIASGLAWQLGFMAGTADAFLSLDCKFAGATKIGDTLRVSAEVAQKRDMPGSGGGMVVFNVEVSNQRDEVVQKGKWSVLVRGMKAAG